MTTLLGIRRWIIGLLGAVAFVHQTVILAADTPAPPSPEFTANYVLSKGALELADLTRRVYRTANDTYVFLSEAKPLGIVKLFTKSTITEMSEWIYVEGQLRPLSYLYDRRGDKDPRQFKINFDWQKLTATSSGAESWETAVQPGILDKLLFHLALIHDLQQGRQELTYLIADSGAIKNHLFTVAGDETVTTELGTFKTLKLERSGNHQTILWCAPQLGYIPVKLEQDGLTMTIKSLSRIPQITVAIPTEPAASKTTKHTESETAKAKR
ncbi:MAG: DUF3108 domain-containing protein [Gammaproteobacteria bacterium]|nr:DUF3108 domain-containing protein [Gammaproteobacteria bacterium]